MRILLPILLCISTFAFATPPDTIVITYDKANASVHIEAAHLSERLEKHFIRRMTIFINGKEVQTLYYHRQQKPSSFGVDVPVTVKAADVVGVDLYCSKGGSKHEEYTIPNETVKK